MSYWRRFRALKTRWQVLSWIGVAFVALIIIGLVTPSEEDEPSQAEGDTAEATNTPKPDEPTKAPTNTATPRPTETPRPTATPLPTATPTPSPISLSGRGQTATDPIALSAGVWVATFTHTGTRNFIVKTFTASGSEDLLINKIGAYSGSRPLTGSASYTLDIQADGAWTVVIAPISAAATNGLTGTGDSVSGLFTAAPGPKTVRFNHTGTRNFVVSLQCDGGRVLAQNVIGALSNATRVVNFPARTTLCYWEVEADGQWEVTPQ